MPESSDPAVTQRSAARTALDYALGYLLLVGFCSLLRGTASHFGGPAWIIDWLPWPEVFYGPAIALGTIFGVSRLSASIETWLRRRRET